MVLLISVCKVFLFDMAEIGGLYRVASFLFLGLALFLLSLIYTRFVRRVGGQTEAAGPARAGPGSTWPQ